MSHTYKVSFSVQRLAHNKLLKVIWPKLQKLCVQGVSHDQVLRDYFQGHLGALNAIPPVLTVLLKHDSDALHVHIELLITDLAYIHRILLPALLSEPK